MSKESKELREAAAEANIVIATGTPEEAKEASKNYSTVVDATLDAAHIAQHLQLSSSGGKGKAGYKTAWTKTIHMMVDRLGVESGAELIRCLLDDLDHVNDELLRAGFDEYPQFEIIRVRGDHLLFVDPHDTKTKHMRKLSSVKSAANEYLRGK